MKSLFFLLCFVAFESLGQCDSLAITSIYETEAYTNPVLSDNIICGEDLLTLEATSINDGEITWDFGVENGVPFLPGVEGEITYTATSSSPDDCPATFQLLVYPNPEVVLTVDPDTLCYGELAVFGVSGADWCDWGYGECAETISTGTPVSICETAIITGVAGSSETGCQNTGSVEIVVVDFVFTPMVSEDTICLGEEVFVYVVPEGDGFEPEYPIYADYYVWEDGIEDSVAFAPDTTGYYYVTGVSTTYDCESIEDVVHVTVNAVDIEVASTDSVLCAGETVTLTSSGADMVTWSDGVVDGESFVPEETNTYVAIGSNVESGCVDSTSIEVVVNPLPVMEIETSDSLVCYGDELTLTATGAHYHFWEDGIPNGDPFIAEESGEITYYVLGINVETDCESTDSVVVTILDEIPITNLETESICAGDSVLIFDEFKNESGVYYDTLSADVYGCDSVLAIELILNELPIVDFEPLVDDLICIDDIAVGLTATPLGGNFSGDGVVDTEFDPSLAGEGVHWLYYSFEDDSACVNSDSIQITVVGCLGLPDSRENFFTIYPNPANDYTVIQFAEELLEPHSLIISSVLGQEIYRIEQVSGTKIELSTIDLRAGVYLISIEDPYGAHSSIRKLIIE